MRSTPFSCAYAARAGNSYSGFALVKLNSDACATQSLAQPWFQPSTSTPLKPYLAAKSMYRRVFFVVAPRPSELSSPGLLGCQVYCPRCIPHQMPTYLPGLIHEVSAMREGGLRLSAIAAVPSTMSDSLSLIITNLQGELAGAVAFTRTPSDHGAR